MATASSHEVTRLLRAWSRGDETALEALVPLIYRELRQRAHRYMGRERPGHTLQTTALVNEVYLRLVDSPIAWESRNHFFAIAARMMLRMPDRDLVSLDEALDALATLDPRRVRVVELRFFGGLSVEETAEALRSLPRP